MRITRLNRFLLATAAIALLPAAAEAKCIETASQPVLPGYVYVLDGQVVGIFEMSDAPPHPPADEILVVKVTCREAADSGVPRARRAAVLVATRAGAPALLARHLRDLSVALETQRAATGSFAADLREIRFFDGRIAVPTELQADADRWKAVARIEGASVVCSAEGRAGSGPAEVTCR